VVLCHCYPSVLLLVFNAFCLCLSNSCYMSSFGWISLEVELEFNTASDTVCVILETVFTANHLTDTDKQNSTGKYTN